MNRDLKVYKSDLALASAIFFGFMGILFIGGLFAAILIPPRQGRGVIPREEFIYMTVMFMIICVLMITGAICALLYYFLRRIKLSENGVTSRDWLGRMQVAARWDQVSDFYFLAGSRNEYHTYVVETANGTITFPCHFSDSEEFRDEVVRRAFNAKANEWLAKGARDFELPRIFNYKRQSKPLFFVVIMVISLVWVSFCLLGWLSLMRDIQNTLWVKSVKEIISAVIVSLFSVLPLLMVTWWVARFRLLRQHKEEEIVASVNSLMLRSPRKSIKLNWSEISDYFIIGRGFLRIMTVYVVRGPKAEIEFYPLPLDVKTFRDWCALKYLIVRKAINARNKRWKTLGSSLIGGEAAKWDKGRRVYSYRTKVLRAKCWFWGLLVSLIATRPLVTISNGRSPSLTEWVVSLLIGLGGPLIIWLAWKVIASIRILTDENGITYEGWWNIIVADWKDVTDFYGKKLWERVFVVETTDDKFLFYGQLADYEDLKDEIKEKATQAKSEEWRKR